MLFLPAFVFYPWARVELRVRRPLSGRNSNHVRVYRGEHVVNIRKDDVCLCCRSPSFKLRLDIFHKCGTIRDIPDKRKEGGPLETAPYFAQLKPGFRKQVVFYSLTMFVDEPRKA